MDNPEDGQEEFNFHAWCEAHGLSKKMDTSLRKEECHTLQCIQLLTERDIREMGLPVGQRNLLLKVITDLKDTSKDLPAKPAEDVAEANDAEQDLGANLEIADIRRQFDTLGAAGKQFDEFMNTHSALPTANSTAPCGPHAEQSKASPVLGMAMDPRTILTVKAPSAKTVHITQFLSEKTKRRIYDRRRKFVFGTDKGDQVTIKADDKHPYTGITLSEWSAANCRLMAHLLESQQLSYDHVTYYLAYTTQIYEFYQSYEWEAILDFDHQYRERQNHHKFMWGYIPPNSEISLLGAPRNSKPNPNTAHKGYQTFKAKNGDSRAPTEECRLFKNTYGNCPYGDKCRFKHVRAPMKDQEA